MVHEQKKTRIMDHRYKFFFPNPKSKQVRSSFQKEGHTSGGGGGNSLTRFTNRKNR